MRNAVLSLSLSFLFTAAAFAANPAIGVSEFKNETSAGWWGGGVGRDLAGMLSNELASTGKFRVVERSKLAAVLSEQDLASSGRINPKTRAKVGKVTGAKYLVFATVTSFEERVAGSGAGLSFRGVSVGGRKSDAYLAIDLRVVDTTTGDIEFSRTVEGRSSSKGLNVGLHRGGFGGNLAKEENTPVGKAIRGAIIEISEYLTCAMVDQDDCMDEYSAKEKSRKEKTKKAITLE